MTLVFQRRLAIPLWAVAFFMVALTAPPFSSLFLMPLTTVFAIAAVAIAAIGFSIPGAIPWLRTTPALARVRPSRQRDQPGAAVTLTAGTGVRTLDEPHRRAADDAIELDRMDDDGSWRMPRPPA